MDLGFPDRKSGCTEILSHIGMSPRVLSGGHSHWKMVRDVLRSWPPFSGQSVLPSLPIYPQCATHVPPISIFRRKKILHFLPCLAKISALKMQTLMKYYLKSVKRKKNVKLLHLQILWATAPSIRVCHVQKLFTDTFGPGGGLLRFGLDGGVPLKPLNPYLFLRASCAQKGTHFKFFFLQLIF